MPRPEDDDVRQLTFQERAFNECYREVTAWRTMSQGRLALISSSTMTMLASFFVFVFFDETCFRDFQVKDRIDDPEGLNCKNFGCALFNLVEDDPPLGWFALALFLFACVTHTIFLKHS